MVRAIALPEHVVEHLFVWRGAPGGAVHRLATTEVASLGDVDEAIAELADVFSRVVAPAARSGLLRLLDALAEVRLRPSLYSVS